MVNDSKFWRRATTVVGAVIICAAAIAAAAAGGTGKDGAAKDDPGKVVATVGKHKITEAELDKRLQPQIAQMRAQLEQKVDQIIADKTFDLRRKTAESMAAQYLVEHAAKRAGLSVPEFLKKESAVGSGVSESDAKKFYDQHKGPRDASFDTVKPRLIEAMNENALLERLRKETPIHILIEPKRTAVDSAGHYSQGPADAPVTIVEFSDFQCPYCRAAEPTLHQLREKYGDKLRLVYMDYPLPFHNHALPSAEAARCAGDQGKFWEFHDALFANQAKFAKHDPNAFRTDLKAEAQKLGLRMTKFDACLDKGKYESAVKKDVADGGKIGVQGTPHFFVNGRMMSGAQPPEKFEEIIDDELANGPGAQKQASAH